MSPASASPAESEEPRVERRGVCPGDIRGPLKPKKKFSTLRQRRMTAIADGKAPPDIMHHNMVYWHTRALKITQELEEHVVNIAADPESAKIAANLFNAMLMARNKSQECARDLAPYWHPKLAQVTVSPGEVDGSDQDEGDLSASLVPITPQEASTVYQRLIAGPLGKSSG